MNLTKIKKNSAWSLNQRATLTYRQESPANKHFRRKRQEIILYGLNCKVFQLQVKLSQNGMATQRYFLVKEKTVGVAMKPRDHFRKFDQFFPGNNRLSYCGKGVKQDGGYIGLVREFLRRQKPLSFFFLIFRLHPCLPPSPNLEYFYEKG